MKYREKIILLLSVIAALILIYAAAFFFDPALSASRSSAYTWLEKKAGSKVSRIVLGMQGEYTELLKKKNLWFVLHDGVEYPARQHRIEDFIRIFTDRAPWPVRYTNAESHSRLALDDSAFSIKLYGENILLLDLLIGAQDSTGYIYIRKSGNNEVRSGNNSIESYISGEVTSWYNLKLFPEIEDGKTDVNSVQRLTVYSQNSPPLIISRKNKIWTISELEDKTLDQNSIDTYIKNILNTDGDDFTDKQSAENINFNHSRLILEFGNGSVKTIRLSEPDESNLCYAKIDGYDYIYSLSSWAAGRLIKQREDFVNRD